MTESVVTRPLDILLVEDTPTDAELTLNALKECSPAANILWVKDGEAALDYLFCQGQWKDREISVHPKVILLDLRLPKVDGLDVLKTLKSNPKLQFIPVVVLTSSKEESDLVRSYQLGANSYITKPIQFTDFEEIVKNLGLYWLILNKIPVR